MTDKTPPALPDIVPMESIDQFAQTIAAWHNNRVAIVKHMATIPPGTQIEYQDKTLTLDGDILLAFQAGLTTALSQLGELPFVMEMEQPDAPTDPA